MVICLTLSHGTVKTAVEASSQMWVETGQNKKRGFTVIPEVKEVSHGQMI